MRRAKPAAQTSFLINSVALRESGNIGVLSDKASVFKVAEEYAHAGIKLLVDMTKGTQHGTFHKHFERELHMIYSELFPGAKGSTSQADDS